MRPFGTVATAMLLAASAIGIAGPAPTARAYTKEEIALNGTYRVTSIGNWAKYQRAVQRRADDCANLDAELHVHDLPGMRRHDEKR